ncbi:hypothetical protein E0K89_021550 [Aquicoccus sp. SCR17]|nr:hypothetical protein [Carideicomes alvinocaridis]
MKYLVTASAVLVAVSPALAGEVTDRPLYLHADWTLVLALAVTLAGLGGLVLRERARRSLRPRLARPVEQRRKPGQIAHAIRPQTARGRTR